MAVRPHVSPQSQPFSLFDQSAFGSTLTEGHISETVEVLLRQTAVLLTALKRVEDGFELITMTDLLVDKSDVEVDLESLGDDDIDMDALGPPNDELEFEAIDWAGASNSLSPQWSMRQPLHYNASRSTQEMSALDPEEARCCQ